MFLSVAGHLINLALLAYVKPMFIGETIASKTLYFTGSVEPLLLAGDNLDAFDKAFSALRFTQGVAPQNGGMPK